MNRIDDARFIPALLCAVAVFLISGCAKPQAVTALGSTLDVLAPDRVFSEAIARGRVPTGWSKVGDIPRGALSIRTIESLPALQVRASDSSFALLRRTRALLLATPFLSWAWNAEPDGRGTHPVRIVVGLADTSQRIERKWWQIGGSDDDRVGRIISLVWDATALGRGTVIAPGHTPEGQPEMATYIARGGAEQAGRWWVDTVDLSLIHRQLWPDDDQSKTEIRYIGIGSRPSVEPAIMNLATIRLAR